MNKIKFLRTELNLTTRNLSAILSLSDAVVSQYENETRDPSTTTIKKLADYFHVTIDYMLARLDLGLFVYYPYSDDYFIINEMNYLKYKDEELIYYIENKRFINISKKLNIPFDKDISYIFKYLSDKETLDGFLDDDAIKLKIPVKRVDAIKKIIVLDDEKFNAIEQMLKII